jgi:hypothetical protein
MYLVNSLPASRESTVNAVSLFSFAFALPFVVVVGTVVYKHAKQLRSAIQHN